MEEKNLLKKKSSRGHGYLRGGKTGSLRQKCGTVTTVGQQVLTE